MRRPIALLLAASLACSGCATARQSSVAATQARTEPAVTEVAVTEAEVPAEAKPGGSHLHPGVAILIGAAIALGLVALALSDEGGGAGYAFIPPA